LSSFLSVWDCDRAGGRSGGETTGKSITLLRLLHMNKYVMHYHKQTFFIGIIYSSSALIKVRDLN